ncbi:hypothetical protein DAI22_03g206200 [Oryza sativa Japonica Group]|nr:hypothetical protein DAI22_03g206200 [Oryza sativa Japonica Group]
MFLQKMVLIVFSKRKKNKKKIRGGPVAPPQGRRGRRNLTVAPSLPLLSHASPPPEQLQRRRRRGSPFPSLLVKWLGAPMRPEHEGRNSARTARSGAVEFGSGPPLAGSRLDARVGGEGGGRGARAARRRRLRWRRPRREGHAEEAIAAATAVRGAHGGGGGGGRGARAARRRPRREDLAVTVAAARGRASTAASLACVHGEAVGGGDVSSPSRLKKPISWSSSPPMARSYPGRGELRERVDAAACAEDDGAMATCGSRPRAYLSRGVVNWANWWLMR